MTLFTTAICPQDPYSPDMAQSEALLPSSPSSTLFTTYYKDYLND
jgi:hypothetical protein